MMIQQFKSMNELIEYLGILEERIKTLEGENKILLATSNRENIDGNAIAKYVSRILPRSNLFSQNFLKRAFTIWGHFFIANLIIGIIVGIAFVRLMMLLFGSLFGNLIQNSK
jgi:hypothetical protein